MRTLAVSLLMLRILAAQATPAVGAGSGIPPRQKTGAATSPEDLCTIEGQVLNAATGEPVRKASLMLNRVDISPGEAVLPPSYGTTTDAQGKFAMKDIEPGHYRLMVNRTGYVSTAYGARGPGRTGTTLSLIRQQHLKDVLFKLTPHGVITGRILDEDGDPLANARVMLQAYRYVQGRKQLSPSGGAGGTNDLGEYRIFGVAPGKYILSATAAQMGPMMMVDRSANAPPDEDYVPTYYPGTIDPASAAQLEVAAGAQLRAIDLTLSKAHTIHIKGHVSYALPGRHNVLVYLARNSGGFMGGPMRSSRPDFTGNFEMRGIPPGSYTLAAVINESNRTYQGRLAIDAGQNNLEDLNVVIGPGVTITGRVHVEGDGPPPDLSAVRFSLQPREPGAMMFGGMSQGRASDQGGFEVKDVAPDRYNVSLAFVPAGFYVKSIRTDQVDVLQSGLDVSGGAPANLDVLLSPKAGAVTGTVQNAKTGNPAPGATVVLVPQERERQDQQTYYKTATSDQNGAFSFKDLPPGDYKAYAWEDIEFGAYMDPDFMKPVESKGEAVSLHESDRKTLQLPLIPADASPPPDAPVARL